MKKTGLFLAIILIGLMLLSSCTFISKMVAPSKHRFNKEIEEVGIDFGNMESVMRLEQEHDLFWLWVHWNPIKYMMDKEEKEWAKEILKIQDSEQRNYYAEKFIEWFWLRRGDSFFDDKNELRDSFYDRVVEAQIRFADRENVYKRKCKYGNGWQADMGLIYILLGEPFDKARYNVNQLMSFSNSNYQQSILTPQDIEVWRYEVPDGHNSSSFQDGVAWIVFERDLSGYWSFVGVDMFNLFYNYENDFRFRFSNASLRYGTYISDIYKLLKAFAKENIYDWDLEFEDVFREWVPKKK